MTVFNLLAVLTTIAAVFAWVNHRFLRLPPSIGLMVLALVSSLAMVLAGRLGFAPVQDLIAVVGAIDFNDTVLNGMLGALLFAGALHVDLDRLLAQRGVIFALATVGVLLSTVIVAVGGAILFRVLGLEIPFGWLLLFGALISPTDPIAVGAILRKAGVPAELQTTITGESLFNDGVGVVLFILLLELLAGSEITVGSVVHLVSVEVVGGLLYGAVIGWIAFRMLRAVDNYQVEILLTLALVTGGYAMARVLHVSGPLAMVVAGLLIGNRGRHLAMSATTRDRLDEFWELIDEFLNAVLFVLIGLEVLLVDLSSEILFAVGLTIPLVLVARYLSVLVPIGILPSGRALPRGAAAILTWSGLRGGVSVALALSLPVGLWRDKLLAITYGIVCFSILIQGLTAGAVARRFVAETRKS